jgi:hypothetical protein
MDSCTVIQYLALLKITKNRTIALSKIPPRLRYVAQTNPYFSVGNKKAEETGISMPASKLFVTVCFLTQTFLTYISQ